MARRVRLQFDMHLWVCLLFCCIDISMCVLVRYIAGSVGGGNLTLMPGSCMRDSESDSDYYRKMNVDYWCVCVAIRLWWQWNFVKESLWPGIPYPSNFLNKAPSVGVATCPTKWIDTDKMREFRRLQGTYFETLTSPLIYSSPAHPHPTRLPLPHQIIPTPPAHPHSSSSYIPL